MKVENGYTLSQLVDFISNFNPKDIGQAQAWCEVMKYNDLIKQSPNEEMFFNELDKPKTYDHWEISLNHIRDLMAQHMDCVEWQEAEKKVIFKGWKKSMYHKYRYIHPNGIDEISFANGSYPKLISNGLEIIVLSLHDLFDHYNGKLELQNVIL